MNDSIEKIINSNIEYEMFKERTPDITEITKPLSLHSLSREDYKFERTVFNYLLKNKSKFGISKIIRFKNAVIDGALKLENKKIVLLEIKYALNWVKCCQARLQFKKFLIKKIYENLNLKKPEDALIIFHHFTSDWGRKSEKHKFLGGWNRFYEEERLFRKSFIKTFIAQLKDTKLISKPY